MRYGHIVKTVCAVLVLGIVFAGCSSRPSKAYVKKIVKEKYTNDIIKVSGIKRENGYFKDSNIYVAEVSYDLTVLISAQDLEQERQSRQGDNFWANLLTDVNSMMSLGELQRDFGTGFQKNTKVRFSESLSFRKKDNGWEYIGE